MTFLNLKFSFKNYFAAAFPAFLLIYSFSYRYAYLACNPAERAEGLQQQVAKIDLDSDSVAIHRFGGDEYPGEPVFIPTGGDAEDEGVIVTLVFDAAAKRSSIVGLDARDVAARPLFRARLKHHVPYSLHGFFAAGLG